MTTYNTYQEAKIDNPDSEILKARDDWQGREELIGKFIANKQDKIGGIPCVGEGYFEICNPADYCITVEQFLKDGHKFAIGDYALDEFGFVIHLTCSTESWSKKDSVDSYRYVLRAKALEQPEQVEWKNGDECVYKNEDDEWNERSGRYVAFDSYTNCHVIHAADANLYHADDDQIKKPESPEEKEQRERLEAAYDLYCDYCKGVSFNAVDFEHFGKSLDCKDTWTAIVDKTNYRKGGD